MSGDRTEVYALRYSARPEARASEAFHRFDLYGEPDVVLGMDYYVWVVRRGDHTVVVDCGFSAETAARRDRHVDTPLPVLFDRVGVDPAAVEDVVLSHMHFDHVGNTDLFPGATFHMARAELAHWGGPHRDHPIFCWPIEAAEVRAVEALGEQARLHLVEDEYRLTPDVRLVRLPGHAPGQLVVHVAVGDRTVVLAADAMHYEDEVVRDRPFSIFTDLGTMLDSYAVLRGLAARDDVDVVAGHDPVVARRHPEVAPECFDLTRVMVDTAVRAPGGGSDRLARG